MSDNTKSQRDKVMDEKDKVSSRISDLCRYIGFGLVAVVYAILTSDSKAVISIYEHYTNSLLLGAALGVSTIIFDYLQYFGGYRSTLEALENKADNFNYKSKSIWYRLRVASFTIKQVSALSGAVILVWVIAASAIHH